MRSLSGLALVAMLLIPAAAKADSIQICVDRSLEGLGDFSGSLDYQVTSSNTATLLLSITNTSTAGGDGGYITAIAMYDLGLSVDGFSSSSSSFDLMGSVSTSPFGDRDFGASSTGGQWLGGGSPTGGIASGQTVTFSFSLSGNVSGVSASDFLANSGFLVRFRGFQNGGSDKVVGKACQPVPEPSSIALALLGAGALAARRRKKQPVQA